MDIKEVCCCAADVNRDLEFYVGDFLKEIFFHFLNTGTGRLF